MAATLIQAVAGGSATGSGPTPINVTTSAAGFPIATTAGSLLVLIAWTTYSQNTNTSSSPAFSLPVTPGFTWTPGPSAPWSQPTSPMPAGRVAIYYIVNAASMAPGATTTIKATDSNSGFTVSFFNVEFSLYEFGQVPTSSAVDASATHFSGTGTPGTTNLTTTQNDLIISAFSGQGSNLAAGSGFTLGPNATLATVGQSEYNLGIAAGSVATGFSGTSTLWGAAAIAFKTTGGPPPPPLPACIPNSGGIMVNGVYIPDLGLYIGPATALYTNPIAASRLASFETTIEGRNSIVIDFDSGAGVYARDLETVFTWPIGTGMVLDVWQPSLIPQPEGIYSRAGEWDNGGTPGAKFIQGIIVEANTFNVPKTFQLQSADDQTYHTLNECPTTFNHQSEQAFSCAPFVAHSARWISSDGVEWQVFGSRLVFQPFPELTLNWQTELTSLGMIGWAHAREMNIAHISTADLTLVLTFDSWPTITLTIPNSGGAQAKTKITLPVNKFKLIGFRVYSTTAFRIFEGDLELKIKPWGSTESYNVLRPFGGPSQPGAIV
jgi:hypothetical protein